MNLWILNRFICILFLIRVIYCVEYTSTSSIYKCPEYNEVQYCQHLNRNFTLHMLDADGSDYNVITYDQCISWPNYINDTSKINSTVPRSSISTKSCTASTSISTSTQTTHQINIIINIIYVCVCVIIFTIITCLLFTITSRSSYRTDNNRFVEENRCVEENRFVEETHEELKIVDVDYSSENDEEFNWIIN